MMSNGAREGAREYHTIHSTELGSQSGLGDEGSIVMMGGANDTYGTPGLGPGPGLDSDYSGGVNEDSRVVSVISKNPPKTTSSPSKTPRQSPKATRRKSFGNDAQKRPQSYAYNSKNSPLYDDHRYIIIAVAAFDVMYLVIFC